MHAKVALILAVVAMGAVGSSLYVWQHQGSGGVTALIEAAGSSVPAHSNAPTWTVIGTSLADQSGWSRPGL